jgi:hypothetical protein
MRAFGLALMLLAGGAATAAAQTVGGRYAVNGTNFNGSSYSGTAVITRSSNTTCRIHWNTGDTTSEGFCMLANRSFAAAYKLGSAIGLVVYDLQPDGSLVGVWTIADKSGSGAETLTPVR